MALAPAPGAVPGGPPHEPSAISLPPLLSQHVPRLLHCQASHQQPAPPPNPTQFPSADPIFRAGINQISHPAPTVTPSQYQTDSRLLLERFFALWVDGLSAKSLRQWDRYWEAVYVFSLTSMFANRLTEMEAKDRVVLDSVDGFGWVVGRALIFRAKVLCWAGKVEEELGNKWYELAEEAEGVAVRVVEMVGRGEKGGGKGGVRLRDGGESLRDKVWVQVVDAALQHVRGKRSSPSQSNHPVEER